MSRQQMTIDRLRERLAQRPSLLDLPTDTLLTLEELARYLALSPSTIEKWIDGERRAIVGLPVYHRLHGGPRSPIRFMVIDVLDWLKDRRVYPTEEGETPARCA